MVGVDLFYLNMSIRKPIVGYDYQNRQGSFISNVDDFMDQDMTGKSKGSNPQRRKFKSSFRSSRISDYYNDGYDGDQGMLGTFGSKRSSKMLVKSYLILSALGGLVASIGIIAINAVFLH